jgi:spermidine synthase
MLWLQSSAFDFGGLPSDARIAAHYEGVMATVSVVEDSQKECYLRVNNKFLMGGTASRFSDGRQGHIPLLLHPDPRRALFLGLGTGATFAVSADHPGLQADGVELIPEVISVLPFFETATGPLATFSQLDIHTADARRFVNCIQESYDVIVADLFHPARDGAGFLYTREHFQTIRSRLSPGGIFCQWLPLYQMDLDVLRTIIRTFLSAFPNGIGFLATNSLQMPIVGLIASDVPLAFEPDYLVSRVNSQTLQRKLAAYELGSLYALLGGFIAGPKDLAGFAGMGPLNTDDHPVVIFQAPRFAYSENEPAYARLLELVDGLDAAANQILKTASESNDGSAGKRLAAYWRARNRFLHAGVGVVQTTDVEKMLAQIRQPLLQVLRESPDFEPAYHPLIAVAKRLRAVNPGAAQKLIWELETVRAQSKDFRTANGQLGNP